MIFNAAFAPLCAHAAESIETIFESDTWPAFVSKRDSSNICFISAIPHKSGGTFSKRSVPHLTISTQDGVEFTVIATSGYQYSDAKPPELVISSKNSDKTFVLQSVGEDAIAFKDDIKSIVENLKKSKNVTLYGTSRAKTESQDVFLLDGFQESFKKMIGRCSRSSQSKKPQNTQNKKPSPKKR